ncbi:PAS domain-containing protein, partial [Archangium violaceum]
MNLETHRSTSPPASLADLLDSRREAITRQWLERLQADLTSGPRSRSALEDHIGDYLLELATVLRHTGDSAAAAVPDRSAEARLHGGQRLGQGFKLPTVVREYGVLHDCILEQARQEGVSLSHTEVQHLASFIVTGIAEAVDAYTVQRDELQRQNELTAHQEEEATRARLLRESEAQRERLAALFQEAPALIFVLEGPEHVLTLANPRLHQAIGVREILGKPLREALPELEDQGFRVLLDNVYRTGEPAVGHEVRVWVYRNGGRPVECFFNFVYAPNRGADGRVEGVFVHAVEVTELVRERQKTEEALALLDTLLTTAPVGLSFMDRDLRYVRVNQMLADIIGAPIENILGQGVKELLPGLASQLAPMRRQVLETGQAVLGQEVTGTTPATGGEI